MGTLLRQWLELRPEVPPTRVRPWLYIGGAHHACDRRLLDRLDIGYVLNAVKDCVLNVLRLMEYAINSAFFFVPC